MNILVKCKCGAHTSIMGRSRVQLYWLGLLPHQCRACRWLQPMPPLAVPQECKKIKKPADLA